MEIRTADDVTRLVGVTESLTLEFKDKRVVGRLDSIGKHVTAMANAIGGWVVVGVSEDDERKKISIASGLDPLSNLSAQVNKISSYLVANVHPSMPSTEVIPIPDGVGTDTGFIAIRVDASDIGHRAPDGKYYRRHSFGSYPLDDYELRELLARPRRASLRVVTLRQGAFEPTSAAELVGERQFVIGLANDGGRAELVYRVVLEPTLRVGVHWYRPDGNGELCKLARYDRGWAYLGSPQYPVFPGAVTPVLLVVLQGPKSQIAFGAELSWEVAGESTPRNRGTIVFG